MARYAARPLTLAAGASGTVEDLHLARCHLHTLQVEGTSPQVQLEARMVGATQFGPIGDPLTTAAIFSDLVVHRVAQFRITNNGANPVTVHLAGSD